MGFNSVFKGLKQQILKIREVSFIRSHMLRNKDNNCKISTRKCLGVDINNVESLQISDL